MSGSDYVCKVVEWEHAALELSRIRALLALRKMMSVVTGHEVLPPRSYGRPTSGETFILVCLLRPPPPGPGSACGVRCFRSGLGRARVDKRWSSTLAPPFVTLTIAVICARQMFGFNTVYTHYESQPVLLTKSCSPKA